MQNTHPQSQLTFCLQTPSSSGRLAGSEKERQRQTKRWKKSEGERKKQEKRKKRSLFMVIRRTSTSRLVDADDEE